MPNREDFALSLALVWLSKLGGPVKGGIRGPGPVVWTLTPRIRVRRIPGLTGYEKVKRSGIPQYGGRRCYAAPSGRIG